jgi:hypothetical protein
MKVLSPAVSAVALACLAASVRAHGYISKPAATYEENPNIEYYTGYNAIITAAINSGFDGGTYNWSPADNVASFTEHWAATGYSSLKELCDLNATDYGWSVDTATPVDVSDYTEFWWQNDQYQEGFIASHRGPCELWIDDTRVWHYDDCANDFTAYPAAVPTDYSSCNGDCLVVFYWLALHSPDWQIYSASLVAVRAPAALF